MCKSFDLNDRISVAEITDDGGDLELNIELLDNDLEEVQTWIDRDGAIDMIAHLKNAFDIRD